ncbi:MAG: D-alanyl-D-alanine carboxypeptidase [Lentisphaeria bacterium]|nr:D-alanyl-D-alanine carboxypeptidase [Lentisphaeria bacterium]
MKLRYIFLTIGLIVLAHIIVLYICFHQTDSEEQTVQKQDSAEQKKTVEPAQQSGTEKPDDGQSTTPAPVSPDPAPQQTAEVVATPRGNAFPAFNFRHAWSGNIPELPASAQARSGILVDADSGNILWDKQAAVAVPIASMTKIMTLLLASEDIASRRDGISLDSEVKVSKAAMKIGGSQVWLDERETFKLEELLRAVAIKSANDAAYQVAEFLGGGDVYGFVARMNRRARQLGMKHTNFFNPHGLPGTSSTEDNVSSPEDMALLAEYCLGHEMIMKMASMTKSSFRNGKLELVNHNNLLPGRKYPAPGVDGLKTGFINRSGYCVTITCKRAGKRMIAVVTGFDTAKNRDLFARQLLEWGYARAADPDAANARSRTITPRPAPKKRVAPAGNKKAPVNKKAPARKKAPAKRKK